MVNIHPKICNICGGNVIFTSNATVYHGKEYGSGKCYLCTSCRAYVGTHKNQPKDALGILADKDMRDMKMKCHDAFDKFWKSGKNSRSYMYQKLARELKIPVDECHFGWFDMEMLVKAYKIIVGWG